MIGWWFVTQAVVTAAVERVLSPSLVVVESGDAPRAGPEAAPCPKEWLTLSCWLVIKCLMYLLIETKDICRSGYCNLEVIELLVLIDCILLW